MPTNNGTNTTVTTEPAGSYQAPTYVTSASQLFDGSTGLTINPLVPDDVPEQPISRLDFNYYKNTAEIYQKRFYNQKEEFVKQKKIFNKKTRAIKAQIKELKKDMEVLLEIMQEKELL